MRYTEQNQKAEFLGGAMAAGCGALVLLFIIVFGILAWMFA